MPEAWYRLPVFYFSNVSEIRGPDDPVWCPAASQELDYELEVCALVDTPAVDLAPERAEEAIGGFMIFNDWSARDLQRDETTVRLGPAKGKDFASSIGPWLVTPDELADTRAGKGYDLAMTATVNGDRDQPRHLGGHPPPLRRDARPRLGGRPPAARRPDRQRARSASGCLLEIKDETLGRWLEPGDEVVCRVERLGSLRTPIVARPVVA